MVAVMVIKRPDDANGIGFAWQLAALREEVANRRFQHVTVERVKWSLDWVEPAGAIEWRISAYPKGYCLTRFGLKVDFLATQDPEMPRISWIVYKGRGCRSLVMGGQAPTWQVGQARAEAIWRIDAGVRSDS
jgi:hypothetical protein